METSWFPWVPEKRPNSSYRQRDVSTDNTAHQKKKKKRKKNTKRDKKQKIEHNGRKCAYFPFLKCNSKGLTMLDIIWLNSVCPSEIHLGREIRPYLLKNNLDICFTVQTGHKSFLWQLLITPSTTLMVFASHSPHFTDENKIARITALHLMIPSITD